MANRVRNFDVIVIGAGVTGLSAAYHLLSRGVSNIAIVDQPGESLSWRSPGLLVGGLADNYSRLVHAFGRNLAKEVWSFSNLAYDRLLAFLKADGHIINSGRRLRIATTESEHREMEIAVVALNDDGFGDRLVTHLADIPGWPEFGASVRALQDEGDRGLVFECQSVRNSLLKKISDFKSKQPNFRIDDSVLEIRTGLGCDRSAVVLETADSGSFGAEMVICANHLGLVPLIPSLQEVMISYSDQWFAGQIDHQEHGDTSLVVSVNHGYEWWGIQGSQVKLGGGRYVRKWAGIGDHKAQVEASAMRAVSAKFNEVMTRSLNVDHRSVVPLLGCRPCDELPIIGPMYGKERLLIAGGFMGYGLALGFLAGECLADIVCTGRSSLLPPQLEPRRLRSLPS